MIQAAKFLSRLNIRTIYINFKIFPIRIATKLPLLVCSKVLIKNLKKGSIQFNCPISTGLIQIGYGNLSIFDNKRSRSIIDITGTIKISGKVRIGHGSKIVVGNNGLLCLGNNFMINAESTIICMNAINIMNDVLLSWDVLIIDDDFHKIIDLQNNQHINKSEEIIICDKVWIGARSLILKGVIIPSNSIIAANSTISKTLSESNCIYGGSPTKILKTNVKWAL